MPLREGQGTETGTCAPQLPLQEDRQTLARPHRAPVESPEFPEGAFQGQEARWGRPGKAAAVLLLVFLVPFLPPGKLPLDNKT